MAVHTGNVPADPGPRPAPVRHLFLFFAVACAFSWLDWGLVIASQHGRLPFTVPLNPLGSFGPAVGALVVAAVTNGRAGVRDLLAPIVRWRFAPRWWLVVFLLSPLLVAISVVIHALDGGTVLPLAPLNVGQLLLFWVILVVVGGPLGEEIGWRGYALPRLLERMGPVRASLVIAVVWAVWHLPLFWLEGSTQAGSSIAGFVALVGAFSILTTWVYLGAARSLLAVILFHQSINVATYFLPTLFPALASTNRIDRILAIVAWVAAGCAALSMWRARRSPVGTDSHRVLA